MTGLAQLLLKYLFELTGVKKLHVQIDPNILAVTLLYCLVVCLRGEFAIG